MANPQMEKGYTRIANELLEAICRLDISGNEMRILLYIIRRTYGFNKSYAEISISEIANGICTSRDNISRTLKKLRSANIIDHRPNKGITPQTISINKNYDEWSVESCSSLLSSKMTTVVKNDNSSVVKNDNSTVVKNDNSSVVKNDNHTYKENTKDNTKERVERKAPLPCHIGDNKRAFVNDDNYKQLVSEYGTEVIDKYIKRADKWAFKKGKDLGECSDTLRRWLEQDGVEKIDPEIEQYKKFINQFQPL